LFSSLFSPKLLLLAFIPIISHSTQSQADAEFRSPSQISEFGSGKLSMSEILAPAIRMAKEGVPEHELNAMAVRRNSFLGVLS